MTRPVSIILTFSTSNVFGNMQQPPPRHTSSYTNNNTNTNTDKEDAYSHIGRLPSYGSYQGIPVFVRDTNKLNYFCVTPFDVNGNDQLHGISSYGGGYTTRQMMPAVLEKSIVGKLESSVTTSSDFRELAARSLSGDAPSSMSEPFQKRLGMGAPIQPAAPAPAQPKVVPSLPVENNNGSTLRQIIDETDGGRKGGGGSKRSTDGEQQGGKVPLQWWKKCLMRLICRG